MKIKYENLRVGDAICTASSSVFGSGIRLWTAPLVKKNGWSEMWKMSLANHVGLCVQMEDRFWIAEMLGTGLEINPITDYLNNPDKDRIVSIRRSPSLDDQKFRIELNDYILDAVQKTLPYDWDGILQYLNLKKDNPKYMYCSEFAENTLNRFGATFDAWQLNRSGKKGKIAPCEIQYGKKSFEVDWKA